MTVTLEWRSAAIRVRTWGAVLAPAATGTKTRCTGRGGSTSFAAGLADDAEARLGDRRDARVVPVLVARGGEAERLEARHRRLARLAQPARPLGARPVGREGLELVGQRRGSHQSG